MIKLIKNGVNRFTVECKVAGIKTIGSENQAVEVLRGLDVDDCEIEAALDEIENSGDDTGHFGICGYFIFANDSTDGKAAS